MQEQVVDQLAAPELMTVLDQIQTNSQAISQALAGLTQIQTTGALATLFELAEVLHAAKQSMTDTMIQKVGVTARVGLETADVLLASGVADKVPATMASILTATREARQKAETDPSRIGPLGLLSALKEPEIQFMLKFMLNLARRLPAAMQG